jgi:hypothetical protein
LEKLNNALRSHVDGDIVWLLTDGIIVPLFKIFLAILASVGVLVDLQACYDKKTHSISPVPVQLWPRRVR